LSARAGWGGGRPSRGAGRVIMLADVNQIGLEAAANALSADGHQVVTQQVDVTSRAAVAAAADVAASSGRVTAVVQHGGPFAAASIRRRFAAAGRTGGA